jgi:putative ABC transport system substrate-binding protein
VADPILFTERPLIVELAAKHRLPAIYETRLFPDVGGFLSYGPRAQERFQRMAAYVDRILRGANPGDLPIERPTTFELIVNLKAAQALGLTIPQSVLVRATRSSARGPPARRPQANFARSSRRYDRTASVRNSAV